jgi:hypothetical protein
VPVPGLETGNPVSAKFMNRLLVAILATNLWQSATLAADQAVTTAPPRPSAAEGMRLIFRDDFEGPLDPTRWYFGPKPDGGQWGGAHFVSKDEPQFSAVYHVQDGVLRIRAHHDLTYQDPEKWGWKEPGPKNPMPADQAWKPGRTWYSGQLALAFPDGHATAAVRKGYFEVRAKLPATPGAWSAPLWLLNVPSIKQQKSSVEIDIEAYGAFPTHWNPSIHDWGPGGHPHAYLTGDLTVGDITTDFHAYGIQITETEVIWYFDDKEVFRKPLYRAADPTLGKFFPIMDLAISYDWPVQIPPSGHIDLLIDRISVYSAD